MRSKRKEPSRIKQTHQSVIASKDNHSLSTLDVEGFPRPHLPPRSRTGCWTCRTRKVKCDEGHPNCEQCTRLGHTCDYSPRLSFRDDTPRVVKRLQGSSISRSSAWNSTSSTTTESNTSSSTPDDPLRPFATLTSDECREKRAELKTPGSFYVVVNPESFSHLPEYSEETVVKATVPTFSRHRAPLAFSLTSSGDIERAINRSPSLTGSYDPNVVVLSRFEDNTRRRNPRLKASQVENSLTVSDAQSQLSVESVNSGNSLNLREDHDPCQSLVTIAAQGRQGAGLLDHFRNRVWRQIVQIDCHQLNSPVSKVAAPGADIFGQEAVLFPPLFHAMMAVSALSLAHQNGVQRIDAFQHYQQALPSLQSNLRLAQDLSSNGTFLTVFLLLIYEIAAAEPGISNLWQQHMAQLRRIYLMRREIFGGERYPFIIWLVCSIDIHAVFSGAGSGEFVGTLMKNNIIPQPSFHQHPLGIDGSSIIYPEESDTLPAVLQLRYNVSVLAARLGLLGQELRKEAREQTYTNKSFMTQKRIDTRVRQRRILELQEEFRHLWTATNIVTLEQRLKLLPRRSKEIFQQASSLSRACLIYSHTSMWPSQRVDTSPESDDDISHCIKVILNVARDIVNAGRLELRFIVFPLFMAGIACPSGPDKTTALDLISAMEKAGVGRNTTTTRRVLEIVYERQAQRYMDSGHCLDVDWIDIMTEQGLQLVSFGF